MAEKNVNAPYVHGPTPLAIAQHRIKELEGEIRSDEALLNERDRLLEEIPHCVAHGLCVPHAIEWVRQVKTLAKVIVEGQEMNFEWVSLEEISQRYPPIKAGYFIDNRKLWRAKVMGIDGPTGEDIKMMDDVSNLSKPNKRATKAEHMALAGEIASLILNREQTYKIAFIHCILRQLVETLLELEGSL